MYQYFLNSLFSHLVCVYTFAYFNEPMMYQCCLEMNVHLVVWEKEM